MTGRYRHLTHAHRLAAVPGYSARGVAAAETGGYPGGLADNGASVYGLSLAVERDAGGGFGPIHRRTLVFILVALLVGGGLLSIVPGPSASDPAVNSLAQPGQANLSLLESEATAAPAAAAPLQETTSQPAAPVPGPAGAISPIFTPEVQYWAPKILAWSAIYGIDADIIATIMQIESCGDPGAASYAGAQGLFQVMPFHFAPDEDMLDPDTNAMRGLAFYNRQLAYTGQNITLSFAGYNGGYAASGSSYPYWAQETQRYYTWASGIYDEARAGQTSSATLQQWLAAGGSGLCRQAALHLGL
jgi:hypothetical protein